MINHVILPCFGPVVPDGYGICYCPQEKQIVFTISSFRSCPDTDSLKFMEKLAETMREMHAVILSAKKLSPNL